MIYGQPIPSWIQIVIISAGSRKLLSKHMWSFFNNTLYLQVLQYLNILPDISFFTHYGTKTIWLGIFC